MKLAGILAAVGISLLSFSAQARPIHRHPAIHAHRAHAHHYIRKHHKHRRVRHVARRPHMAYRAYYEVAQPQEAYWGGNADLLSTARRYVGMGKFTGMPGPWCRDALNVWMRAAGYRTDRSRRALDAVSLGRRVSPAPGTIAVMRRRGRGAGHTGVVEQVTGNGVILISGNSAGGRVARTYYPLRRIAAFVQPQKAQ